MEVINKLRWWRMRAGCLIQTEKPWRPGEPTGISRGRGDKISKRQATKADKAFTQLDERPLIMQRPNERVEGGGGVTEPTMQPRMKPAKTRHKIGSTEPPHHPRPTQQWVDLPPFNKRTGLRTKTVWEEKPHKPAMEENPRNHQTKRKEKKNT
ncbi:hypothetical protein GQ457_11G004720 [Hibiscus cannabinus]